eukprot:jgi/Mesvir1/7200/Mv25793-RA.1
MAKGKRRLIRPQSGNSSASPTSNPAPTMTQSTMNQRPASPQERNPPNPAEPDPCRLEDEVMNDLPPRQKRGRRAILSDDSSEQSESESESKSEREPQPESQPESEPESQPESQPEPDSESEPEFEPEPKRKRVRFVDDEAGVAGDDDDDEDDVDNVTEKAKWTCNCCEPPFVAKNKQGLSCHVTAKIKRAEEARRKLSAREGNDAAGDADMGDEETEDFVPLKQKRKRGSAPLKNMTLHVSISAGSRDLTLEEEGILTAFHEANGGKGMTIVEEGPIEQHRHAHMLIDVQVTSQHAFKQKLKKELGWGERVDELGKHDKTRPSIVTRQVKPSHKLNYSGMIGYLLKSEEENGFTILYDFGIDEEEKIEGRIEYLLHGSPNLKGRLVLNSYNLLDRAAVYWFKHHDGIGLHPS